MKLKDMIESLKRRVHIVIRNNKDNDLCEMESDSEAIKYFSDKRVTEWFPTTFGLGSRDGFIVYLEEDSEADGEGS